MVGEFLRHIYGEVNEQYGLELPADVEGYKDTLFYKDLKKIHAELQNHRGFCKGRSKTAAGGGAKTRHPVPMYPTPRGVSISFA